MDKEILKRATRQSKLCRIFGNLNRMLILWTLAERECSVGEVASAIEASLQNTSQHLRLMQAQGILESHREGNTIYYRLVRDALLGCGLLSLAEPVIQRSSEGVIQNDNP